MLYAVEPIRCFPRQLFKSFFLYVPLFCVCFLSSPLFFFHLYSISFSLDFIVVFGNWTESFQIREKSESNISYVGMYSVYIILFIKMLMF